MPRAAPQKALPAPASIGAVAERAGVSIATVSRVINGVANKASAQTVQRVRDAVQALGYRPMGAGRSLRQGRSRLVALLAANLSNPSMAAIAAGAEVALRNAGYVMVLADTHDRPELQDEYLLEMRAQYARAFVLLAAVDSPVLRAMSAGGDESLVFVNRRNPAGGGVHVGIDNWHAGAEVAQWFWQRQLREVALIHGRLFSSATAERVDGFITEAKRLGLALPKSRIVAGDTAEHLEIGLHGMAKILAARARPQGIFCTSDLIAYGAHRRAELDGVDFIFVGFDDSPLNEWVAPWLNAVRVPYADYGAAIVRALQGGAQPPADIVLKHEMVTRQGDPDPIAAARPAPAGSMRSTPRPKSSRSRRARRLRR